MTNRRVLIIDSQEQDLQHLKQMLEDAGYRADVAHNGEEGLRLAQELFPEVVLLAIQRTADFISCHCEEGVA